MKQMCDHLRTWLLTQTHNPTALPPEQLIAHITSCATCRGQLVLLMTEIVGVPLHIQGISCERCQRDLPAYIDMEAHTDLRLAVQTFPEIWWHLWTCEECAETYRVIVEIGKQQVPSEILRPMVVHTPNVDRPAWLFELSRTLLNHFFQTQVRLGVAWGEHNGDAVVLEEVADDHEITFSLQRDTNNGWKGVIRITPPITGRVGITIGTHTLVTTLSVEGVASVLLLPNNLIEAADGPSISVFIEPDELQRT